MGFRLLRKNGVKRRGFCDFGNNRNTNEKPRALTRGFLVSGGTDGTRTRDPCVTGRYSNRLNYRSTEFFTTTGFMTGLLLNLIPGSSLLSHGETPHYHRRYGVSLLSSAWGQVGPPR